MEVEGYQRSDNRKLAVVRGGLAVAQRWARVFLIPETVSDSVERAGCLSIPCISGSFETPEGERLDESDHYVDDRLRDERPPGGRAEGRHSENQSRRSDCGHHARSDAVRFARWRDRHCQRVLLF